MLLCHLGKPLEVVFLANLSLPMGMYSNQLPVYAFAYLRLFAKPCKVVPQSLLRWITGILIGGVLFVFVAGTVAVN